MRRPVAEWLLVPLFLLPVAAGPVLALIARNAYVGEIDRVRAAGEREARARIEAIDRDDPDWTRRLREALPADLRDATVLPEDVAFVIEPEGRTGVVRGVDPTPGLDDGVWRCSAAYPVGLAAAALADPDVRLRVETGEPPIRRGDVDAATRRLADLLSGPQDPRLLRESGLPVSTCRFVVRRWEAGRSPEIERTARLLDTLAETESWWRGRESDPAPGVHRAGHAFLVVTGHDDWVVLPSGFPAPRPVAIRPGLSPDDLVRLEYRPALDDRADPDALWSGRLETPLAGRWRLVAVHGDAWWETPVFRRFAGPVAAGLLAFELLPIALLVALVKRRRLDEARRRFLTELAHDLRTPLTSVRLYAEMLAADRVPEEEKGTFLGVLARESARLSSLLANLLDLSRLERGSRSIEVAPVDVGEAVAAAIRDLAAITPERAGDVTADGPAGVHALVDPTALARALANLLENAAKFTPAGTVIRVGWRDDGDTVAIRVEDDGPGIPAKERSRLFDRFRRGARAVRDAVPGTGLGLSLVRELMEESGGSVTLAPSDRGAAFEIRLRRAPV